MAANSQKRRAAKTVAAPLSGQSPTIAPAADHPASLAGQESHAALETDLRKAVEDIFRRESLLVPPQLAERVTQELTVQIERSASYQGPMPPPAMLAAFDNVVPGLAREIADAAHEERRHRHRWERRALWNDIFTESGGLFLGWILALGCACAAAFLAYLGNNIGAGILFGAPLLAMVRTIILRSKNDGSRQGDQLSASPQNIPNRPKKRR